MQIKEVAQESKKYKYVQIRNIKSINIKKEKIYISRIVNIGSVMFIFINIRARMIKSYSLFVRLQIYASH